MTHPTDEQLQAWIDGEPDASQGGGEDISAHVEQCVRCQGVIEGAQQLGSALRMWSEDSVAGDNNMAERVLASGKSATVTPIASRKRSYRWLLGPATMAAAAATIFALVRGPMGHSNGSTQPTLVANPTATGATDAGAGATLLAQADLGGSEVLALEADGAHTTYSVLEMAGEREGTTVAVVWIGDKFDNASDPVQ